MGRRAGRRPLDHPGRRRPGRRRLPPQRARLPAVAAPVTVDTSAPTVMAGLNCGTVSSTAWPAIRDGLDAGIGVTDAEALDALGRLHGSGVPAGPCGAAAPAGIEAAATVRQLALLLSTDTDIVLVCTEASAASGRDHAPG